MGEGREGGGGFPTTPISGLNRLLPPSSPPPDSYF